MSHGEKDREQSRPERARGTSREYRGPSSQPVKEGLEGAVFEEDEHGSGGSDRQGEREKREKKREPGRER
ncbi:MAG TPA: hypothetical protein VFK13_15655 [Gemmatimonadaceae bacterium]|nr:hypothetical protein [Gemmatimonadaceae bacterium]